MTSGRERLPLYDKALEAKEARPYVDAFSFQARPFYERLGYTIFGQIDDYPAGHTRFFLQKRNLT